MDPNHSRYPQPTPSNALTPHHPYPQSPAADFHPDRHRAPSGPPSGAPTQPALADAVINPGRIPAVPDTLEGTIVNLYQSLTELQACSGTVIKGGEGLAAGASSRALSSLARLATLLPDTSAKVPFEVIDLLDQDKNPHQHTRDQLERVAGENQFTRGKVDAIADFTRLLEESLFEEFPDLRKAMGDAASEQNTNGSVKIEGAASEAGVRGANGRA